MDVVCSRLGVLLALAGLATTACGPGSRVTEQGSGGSGGEASTAANDAGASEHASGVEEAGVDGESSLGGTTSTSSTGTSTSGAGDAASTEDSAEATSSSGSGGAIEECGDGVFDPRMPYCFGPPVVLDPTPAYDVASLDATGDGIRDIVAATADGVAVFPGLGGGELGPVEVLATPSAAVRLLLTEIDAGIDYFPDLAVACPASDTVVVLRSVAGEALVAVPSVPTGDEPVDVAMFASQGAVAVGFVVAEASAGTISAYDSTGDGTFVLAQTFAVGGRPIAVGWAYDWIVAADTDDDLLHMIWLDPAAHTLLTSHPMAEDPVRLWVTWFGDVGGEQVMVLAEGADLLTIFRPDEGELTEMQSADYPGGPHDVALGGFTREVAAPLFVAGRLDGTVSISPAADGEAFYLDPPVEVLDVGPEPVAVRSVTVAGGTHDDLFVASPISGVVRIPANH